MGIEPNEHRIPRFLGKYSCHTRRFENLKVLFTPFLSVPSRCSAELGIELVQSRRLGVFV